MSYPIRKSPLRLSRFRLSLTLLGLIAIAFSGSAFASAKVFQGGFTILGSVSLADGKPAPYFKVKISGMTGLNFEVQTTDQGRYQFFNIPNGRYRLTAYDPADSTSSSEATEADTSRAGGNRLMVH